MMGKRTISRRLVGGLLASAPLAITGTTTVATAQDRRGDVVLPEHALDYMQIERLIYRYAAAIDNLDSGAMQGCFAANGALVLSPKTTLTGDFAAGLFERAHSKFACTMHNVQNHLYEIDGNTAHGWTYCVASHIEKRRNGHLATDYYIRYDDQLAKSSDGQWLFTERRLHTLFAATAPVKMVSPPEGRARGRI